MKALPTKVLSVLTCLLMTLLLTACATQSSKEPSSLASQYIHQTERNAQAAMVTVYWITPPSSKALARMAKEEKN